MGILKSKETRFFEKVVKNMKNYIFDNSHKTQLISLYLSCRILTKDRAPTRDIEIFGIVNDKFDMNVEKNINQFFDKNPKFCEDMG